MLCGGDTCRSHQFLCESFAPFECSTCCTWAKDAESSLMKDISDTGKEWHFWTDNCEIDVSTLSKICQFRELGSLQWYTFGKCCHTWISRRRADTRYLPTLC
jgi:hypothetical protein